MRANKSIRLLAADDNLELLSQQQQPALGQINSELQALALARPGVASRVSRETTQQQQLQLRAQQRQADESEALRLLQFMGASNDDNDASDSHYDDQRLQINKKASPKHTPRFGR